MSLLDNGPHLIEVYPQQMVTDSQGNTVPVPSDTSVQMRCQVQPVTSNEVDAGGYQVATVYRVIGRSGPLGPWAKVVWMDREWDIIGEPRHYTNGRKTQHVDCLIRARGVQA